LIFVGIDWSERHHEVEVQAESGKKLKALKVSADLAGLRDSMKPSPLWLRSPARLRSGSRPITATGSVLWSPAVT